MSDKNKWQWGGILLHTMVIGAIAGAALNYREILEKKRKEKENERSK